MVVFNKDEAKTVYTASVIFKEEYQHENDISLVWRK